VTRLPKKVFEALFLLILFFAPLFEARAQQSASASSALTQQQIDQMVAPIALYPDPLVAQILMAATYPLEIVEADRWLKNSPNAQLQGDALTVALAQQPWDPSVKSLVAFPQILGMMNDNLQWTEQLGDAFLAEQAAVMDSVQRLRQMAEASGHLASTPQQTVSGEPGEIVIEPSNPQIVYVPAYDPTAVYGLWPYPDYPPYYFPWPGVYYSAAGLIGFGFGIAVVDWLWGWDSWDWHRHRIDIDDRRFAEINGGRAPLASGVWEHDPAHRHGVPYANAAASAQFQGAADQERRNFRGFAAAPSPVENRELTRAAQPIAAMRETSVVQRASVPVASVSQPRQERQAPVFESFSRGADVRAESQRGSMSFAAMRAPSPARAAPRISTPSARGGQGQNVRMR